MDRSKPYIEKRWVEEDRGHNTPCRIWQLRVSKEGYGKVRVKGRDWLAHRWEYTRANGPIPEGLHLDHLCGVRDCVNPDHLEPVTQVVNTRRGRSSKLTQAQANAIYADTQTGRPRWAICAEYEISASTVSLIAVNGPHGKRRR